MTVNFPKTIRTFKKEENVQKHRHQVMLEIMQGWVNAGKAGRKWREMRLKK